MAATKEKISGFDSAISNNVVELMKEGRETFRNDTFGSEAFWGDKLGLHEAIEGSDSSMARGVSPKTALSVGLKVDAEALPADLVEQIKKGAVNLDDPATTVALLKLGAVVGVKGFFEERGKLRSVGVTCALCHSTVDDSFSAGIGRRLDGWANRDLDIGKIVSLAPHLDPIAAMLKTDVETVKKVLQSWGPGKYDAELDKDGKAFRPDGKSSATLLPPAYGLAGVNLHTYTGFGSVTYWNAYVATTQMHGKGVYVDERLKDSGQFPVAARTGSWNTRSDEDRITPKLAALHFYELSIPAPRPPAGSFDEAAFRRGQNLFGGKAKCASCHVPPLYTEPGNNLHSPAEIGIDSFQAERSPTKAYRTTPLRGLWAHQKGGFYHDGRFATLAEVLEHYDRHLDLKLSDSEKKDLIQFLLGL
jgi:mono/diheme cytochrome c family protein